MNKKLAITNFEISEDTGHETKWNRDIYFYFTNSDSLKITGYNIPG